MSDGVFLVLSLVGLLFAHLAATAVKSLQDIAWHDLQDYSRRRDRKRFDEIHDDGDEAVVSIETLLYLSIAVHALSCIVWISRSHLLVFASALDFAIGVIAGTFVLLSAIVWFPNAISELAGTRFLFHTWPAWRAIHVALRPMAWGARGAKALLRRMLEVSEEADEEEALEEEIRSIVTEGQHDGLLDRDVRDMIEGVIELDDTNVADIMTPHDEMDLMPLAISWNQILDYVTQVGRTRIPVYDASPDDFVGVLYVKDLFAELRKPEEARRALREILREKWDVPTTMHLDELLQQFRKTRNHLALVVDEYNAVTGLVTIEDVLEEIVGEIVDESDKEDQAEIRMIDDSHAIVVGRAHVQDVNETLGYDLPEDDEFDTIGGFLMHQLGRVPKKGEFVQWNGLQISVLEASRRRAELVRIAPSH